MDFVVDSLFNGHRFRALTIVDNYSRECLAIEAGQSMTGTEVAAVVDRLVKERGVPDRIQCDNGSGFISSGEAPIQTLVSTLFFWFIMNHDSSI
jgi:putative transposase